MSTPECKEMIQNSLNSGGAIRKSLLTPYRRIGLSRNRQTSKNKSFVSPLQSKEIIDNVSLSPVNQNANQTSKNTFSVSLQNKEQILIDNISVSPVSQNSNEGKTEKICTTPLIHNKCKKLNNMSNKQNWNLNEDKKCQDSNVINEKLPKIKKNERRKISHKDKEEEKKGNKRLSEGNPVKIVSEKESNLCSSKMLESLENDTEYSTSELINTKSVKSDVDNAVEKDFNDLSKKARNKDYIGSVYSYVNNDHDIIKPKDKSIINIPQNENQCEVQEITDNLGENILNTNLNPSIIVRRLEEDKLKKESDKVHNVIQTPYVVLEKNSTKTTSSTNIHKTDLDENILITTNEKPIYNIQLTKKSNKSFKRKLSLRKSTSNSNLCESGEISNTANEQDKVCSNKHSLKTIDEVIKLEMIVENKEDELRRLQQAQIYRNIHKIDDLKEETSVWKNGCQEALRDLLIKLNEHNTIDMSSLLSKLKIPPHLITYDIENDSFL